MHDDGPWPTDAEAARAHAYLVAFTAGFGIPWDAWNGRQDGTAFHIAGDGTTLLWDPADEVAFTFTAPCARHGAHDSRVRWPHELQHARRLADTCGAAERLTSSFGWFDPQPPAARPGHDSPHESYPPSRKDVA